MSKEERRQVHGLVRKNFPDLDSVTKDQEEGAKKLILVEKKAGRATGLSASCTIHCRMRRKQYNLESLERSSSASYLISSGSLPSLAELYHIFSFFFSCWCLQS